MSSLENELIDLIKTKVQEKWGKNKEPYLLSSVGSDYKGTVPLKKVLNGKRLKEWAILNQDNLKIDISIHPTQKEKIGLIPQNERYDYPDEIKEVTQKIKKNKKAITLGFLGMLGELSEEEADKIIIPTSILTKLLGE
ncbi:hypothetical protein [Citrobacter farmeri]|uniref:hypothetical protein n=1 Tax=Citrobacter farmeri TaxID=67824 RepID=UPI0018A1076D|nr:hypothetical protein [Citrobacter farmeri]MDZ7527261.1 hypothetical protein [Citrobacter farmeri]HED3137360.1 hypothetical protein [Citrobacter farmeri]